MVPLAESDQGSDKMVARRVPVVKWLITKPMGQRVDTECGLLNEEDSKNASVDEAAQPVVPAKASNQCREY